eukprot:2540648-Pyramimonas_sp.AAC.1
MEERFSRPRWAPRQPPQKNWPLTNNLRGSKERHSSKAHYHNTCEHSLTNLRWDMRNQSAVDVQAHHPTPLKQPARLQGQTLRRTPNRTLPPGLPTYSQPAQIAPHRPSDVQLKLPE